MKQFHKRDFNFLVDTLIERTTIDTAMNEMMNNVTDEMLNEVSSEALDETLNEHMDHVMTEAIEKISEVRPTKPLVFRHFFFFRKDDDYHQYPGEGFVRLSDNCNDEKVCVHM
jgi:hypothetical protein